MKKMNLIVMMAAAASLAQGPPPPPSDPALLVIEDFVTPLFPARNIDVRLPLMQTQICWQLNDDYLQNGDALVLFIKTETNPIGAINSSAVVKGKVGGYNYVAISGDAVAAASMKALNPTGFTLVADGVNTATGKSVPATTALVRSDFATLAEAIIAYTNSTERTAP